MQNIGEIILKYSYEVGFDDKDRKKLVGNDLYEYARWGLIQRNMRILGTLSNLYIQKTDIFRPPDLQIF